MIFAIDEGGESILIEAPAIPVSSIHESEHSCFEKPAALQAHYTLYQEVREDSLTVRILK
jgi:hypothetical protein